MRQTHKYDIIKMPSKTTTQPVSSTNANSPKEKGNCFINLGATLMFFCALALIGILIYNFIVSIIAVISFSNEDVENVCPNSELWWYALFLGVIWPILASNGVKETAKKSSEDNAISTSFCVAVTYICMLTAFIVWAWDQLWGVPGFANDTCAMDNWEIYNATEGADNDGYKLYKVVKWWMYIYMVIDSVLILGFLGIGGIIVVDSWQSTRSKNSVGTTTTYKSNGTTTTNDEHRLQQVLSGEHDNV